MIYVMFNNELPKGWWEWDEKRREEYRDRRRYRYSDPEQDLRVAITAEDAVRLWVNAEFPEKERAKALKKWGKDIEGVMRHNVEEDTKFVVMSAMDYLSFTFEGAIEYLGEGEESRDFTGFRKFCADNERLFRDLQEGLGKNDNAHRSQ